MALPTSLSSYIQNPSSVPAYNLGNKPSVLDLVILKGAYNTPLLDMFKKGSVTNISHAWLTDTYRSAKSNANMEKADVTDAMTYMKQKTENYTQIFKNEAIITKTQDAVQTYGGKELQHQILKTAREHALDIEYALLGLHNSFTSAGVAKTGSRLGIVNSAAGAKRQFTAAAMGDQSTTPRTMAGLFYYVPLAQRKVYGTVTNPTNVDTATVANGDLLDLTYDRFCEILQTIWANGGEPSEVIVGATLKKAINKFAMSTNGGDKTSFVVQNGGQTYDPRVSKVMTDFGIVNVRLHRFFNDANELGDTMLALDPSTCSFKTLISTSIEDIPTSETAIVKRFFTEGTLEVLNNGLLSMGQGLK